MSASFHHPIVELFEVEEVPWFHLVVEGILVCILVYLFTTKSYGKKKSDKFRLTKKEEESLLREFEPEPLAPSVAEDASSISEGLVVDGKFGTVVSIDGNDCVNVGSYNFLGLSDDERVENEAVRTIRHYGVGSCGPRGFYGTIDCHEDLEDKIAAFMGAEECVLYSYGFSTIASAIPAYSKRGDILFVDEAVCFAIQKGVEASRSTVIYFNHNDMADLASKLEAQKKIDAKDEQKAMATRRFIVTEGIFVNTGNVCPLKEMVELKYKYKTRIIIDETLSFGVLGAHGRGITEESGVDIADVDVVAVSMGGALGSIGGFCCGRRFVMDHQRLSGQGYCFSASLPPLLATAASKSLSILNSGEGLTLLAQLKANAAYFREAIARGNGSSVFTVLGDTRSPMMHLYLASGSGSSASKASPEDQDKTLRRIANKAAEHGVFVASSSYIRSDEHMQHVPSLRICISAKHTKDQLDAVAKGLLSAASA